MKKTLALLAASTALTAAIALPVWSAIRLPADSAAPQSNAVAADSGRGALPLILASDDDDDDRKHRRSSGARDDDDDDDDYDGDDDDDDDDDEGRRGTPPPASAGTVAPPQNGLFGNGAPPVVRVN